jgi:signal transduction histidine kinase
MDYSLLDHLQNPIFVVDENAKVLYSNHFCSSYFGLPPRKLKAIDYIYDLFKVEKPLVMESLNRALKEKSPIVSTEITLASNEDNKVQTVILKFIPTGKSVIIALHDLSIEKQLHEKYKDQVSELRETHHQIVKTDKLAAIGELIAGVGHEISNPLTIINNRISKIEENLITLDLDDLAENVKEVTSGVSRINKIIANMQSFVRSEDDERELVSLIEVLNDSKTFIEDLGIKSTNIIITADKDIWTFGNGLKIQQVFINLLKNSIQACTKGEVSTINITLRLDEEDQSAAIEFHDNGPGVNKDSEDKIFDMFFTSKELDQGTGLGLAISRKIMESMQGTIELVSSKVGAKFVCSLPIVEFATYTNSNSYLSGEKDIEDPKVLIVGTNLSLVNSVYKSLENEDLVIICSNHLEKVEDLVDFFAVDFIYHFEDKLESDVNNFSLKDISLESFDLIKGIVIDD